jgi:(1->4)-alpha-D-glucan 1-alpha-D-glucosylmutase
LTVFSELLSPTGTAEHTSAEDQPVDPAAVAAAERLGSWLAGRQPMRAPRATYRIQFHAGFTFQDAAAVVPYLAALGVDTLYASPIFQARPGSTHGYDVVDYNVLNPELGGEEGFAELRSALDAAGLGLLLDFVPNHMGIGEGTNSWWLSVLEHGRCSPWGSFFDIDWDPLAADMRGRVLLPILGDQYGVILEGGELKIEFDAEAGAFRLAYYANILPLAPETYPMILRMALEEIVTESDSEDENFDLLEFQSIVTALERLPDRNTNLPEEVEERQRETTIAQRRLAELVARSPVISAAIATATERINGVKGDPSSFDLLDQLLEAQVFRLAYWRVAAEEINYRRFFAINDLASIRQEDPHVFAESHALLLRLLAEGAVTGVRIDHIDGLLDPAGYARALQRAYLIATARREYEADAATANDDGPEWAAVETQLNAWLDEHATDSPALVKPVYLLVEKILEHGEDLPSDWLVDGTTGYEFANSSTGLFVDGGARKAFDDLYAAFIGERRVRLNDIVYEAKRMILRDALASELSVLADLLDEISAENRRSRDFTPQSLRTGLREVIAGFPVYRSYVAWDEVNDTPIVQESDRHAIEAAVAAARKRNSGADPSLFAFIRDVLLVQVDGATPEQRAHHGRFAVKVQQLSGPVMAKGLEDTAFFRYLRLLALNEVGGDPGTFGTTVHAFHAENRARLARFPDAMVASSTHDTKRAEDVRARIAVLSEIPGDWRAAINRWARFNRRFKTKVEGEPAPDRNDEYYIYQTILGAWPFDDEATDPEGWSAFVDRVVENTIKATREASIHTSWIAPSDYEGATEQFIRAILDASTPNNRFFNDVRAIRTATCKGGLSNGLAMQLLKLTVPGVPDIYQGTDSWDFSLTDPDNRRPVDFDRRVAALAAFEAAGDDLIGTLVAEPGDGRIKQFVTSRTLAHRRDNEDLFRRGDYDALDADGPRGANVVAFDRRLPNGARGTNPDSSVVVVVPRLVHTMIHADASFALGDAWGTTVLTMAGVPVGTRYRNVFTGEIVERGERGIALADLLATFPVALLERITD